MQSKRPTPFEASVSKIDRQTQPSRLAPLSASPWPPEASVPNAGCLIASRLERFAAAGRSRSRFAGAGEPRPTRQRAVASCGLYGPGGAAPSSAPDARRALALASKSASSAGARVYYVSPAPSWRRGRCKPSRRRNGALVPVQQRCGLPPPVRRLPPKARCAGASESCRRSSCRRGGSAAMFGARAQPNAGSCRCPREPPSARSSTGGRSRGCGRSALYCESSRRRRCSTTGGRRRVLLSVGTVAQMGAPPAPEGRRPLLIYAPRSPRASTCVALT